MFSFVQQNDQYFTWIILIFFVLICLTKLPTFYFNYFNIFGSHLSNKIINILHGLFQYFWSSFVQQNHQYSTWIIFIFFVLICPTKLPTFHFNYFGVYSSNKSTYTIIYFFFIPDFPIFSYKNNICLELYDNWKLIVWRLVRKIITSFPNRLTSRLENGYKIATSPLPH